MKTELFGFRKAASFTKWGRCCAGIAEGEQEFSREGTNLRCLQVKQVVKSSKRLELYRIQGT